MAAELKEWWYLLLVFLGFALIFTVAPKLSRQELGKPPETNVTVIKALTVESFLLKPNGSTYLVRGRLKLWHGTSVAILEGKVNKEALQNFLAGNISYFRHRLQAAVPVEVEFSCRKDVGICSHDGRICFTEAYKDSFGNLYQFGAKSCNTGRALNYAPGAAKEIWLYFTGIGCPHCAKTDPALFYSFLPNHSQIALAEYEIYREAAVNAKVFEEYLQRFFGPEERWYYGGVPHLRLSNGTVVVGDTPILKFLENYKK